MRSWLERWPERLDYETQALESAGIKIDGRIDDPHGRVTLHLSTMLAGNRVGLKAVFPSLYPYTRFEVYAPDLDLEHHQNPFGKNLCMIGQATENWRNEDTLASYIKDRLPLVLEAASSTTMDEVAVIEEHQAEPVTAYYRYEQDALILVNSDWSIDPTAVSGTLRVGYRPEYLPIMRGAVLEVLGPQNRTLATADGRIAQQYQNEMQARWVRMSVAPKTNDPADILHQAAAIDNQVTKTTLWHPVKGGRVAITAIVVPEEIAWRKTGDGWLFVVHWAEAQR